MKKYDVTVIILSYNSRKVTDTCLSKLKLSIDYCSARLGISVETIVVDNNSTDGSPDMIVSKHPWVSLVRNKENLGYARGNNIAMKQSATPFILLMNSDTYIGETDVYTTLQKFIQRNDCDVLVSRWTTADGVFHAYGGYTPTPIRVSLWSLGCESLPFINRLIPKIYSYNPEFYTREGFMEWCPPCFMLLRRAVYTKTGGFDEKLFFHMVDVEWCHRMKKAGFRIGFTPSVEVIHLGGASSKGMDMRLIKDNFRAMIHFCRKHFPNRTRTVFPFLRAGLTIRSILFRVLRNNDLAATYLEMASEIPTF